MNSIYQHIHEAIKTRKRAALCIITKASGSTPRKAGTKMLVFENGNIQGTVGGGSFEKMVIEKALILMQENSLGIYDFNLTEKEGMACGGFAQVYIETIQQQKQLVIFGAGHIGKALAPMAKQLNFGITLVDERPGIFNDLKESGYRCINKQYAEAFADINFTPDTYVCVMTHSHDFDKDIVAHCGKQNLAYLGMIGSKRKIEKIKQEFIDNNVLTDEQMLKINWPMGLSINCQTPEEIAVSVLAKLVDVSAS